MLESEPTLITFKIDSVIELGLNGLGGDVTLNEPYSPAVVGIGGVFWLPVFRKSLSDLLNQCLMANPVDPFRLLAFPCFLMTHTRTTRPITPKGTRTPRRIVVVWEFDDSVTMVIPVAVVEVVSIEVEVSRVVRKEPAIEVDGSVDGVIVSMAVLDTLQVSNLDTLSQWTTRTYVEVMVDADRVVVKSSVTVQVDVFALGMGSTAS
jgi:hypothetical protein